MTARDYNTLRRKLSIATWTAPSEGNILGKLTLDATEVERYLAWVRRTTGEKVTITHFVGRCVGAALAEAPSLNGYLRFDRYVPHESVDVAFLVALEEGQNLAKAKVAHVDRKSVAEIARELSELAARLHRKEDLTFQKSMGPVALLPVFLLRPLLFVAGFLASALGLSVPALGIERFPFGSAIITSVGMLGLDEGFAPFPPFTRVPVLVLVGAIREAPFVLDGAVVPRRQITITATIDHRFMDGYQGAILARNVRSLFANPWRLEGLDAAPADADG